MAGQQLPQPQQPITDSNGRVTRPWYAFLLTVQQWLGPIPGVLSASTLLGRGASAAGSPEQITLGTGLSMAGTVLSSTGGGTVTHTAGALSSGKSVIGNGGADITVSSLTAQFVGSSSGTPAAASMSTARLLGRTTASSGAVEEITAGAGLTLSGGTLTATGSTGGLVLLEEHTASTAAALNFTTCITGTYDDYLIRLVNVLPTTTGTDLLMQVSTDGGSTYDTSSSYYYAVSYIPNSSSGGALQGGPVTAWTIFTGIDSTLEGVNGEMSLTNPANAAHGKTITFLINARQASFFYAAHGAGLWTTATAVNAFRFLFSSGTIASGTIRVYGLAR